MKLITETEARDTGMAMVLICLLGVLFSGQRWLLIAAIVLLVTTMTWPKVFKVTAKFWFGFSHHLGNFVSKIILTLLFFIIVTPVALIRRLFGADPLRLRWDKNASDSAFIIRDQKCSAADLERPY